MKLTCFMAVYNEERRIGRFLDHATKWADNVVICDKGSTDKTRRIAREKGATVKEIEYSQQGWESSADLMKTYGGEWNINCTPGDVPTKRLIVEIRKIIDRKDACETDAILIPRKTYSFGECQDSGPWGVCYIPMAIRRDTQAYGERIHSLIDDSAKTQLIKYDKDTHMMHLTHISASCFLSSHAGYAIKMAESSKKSTLQAARRALRKKRLNWNPFFRGSKQYHAWMMYQHSICLAALVDGEEENIKRRYEELIESYTIRHWQ